jgi:hypothetical protein
MTRWSKAPASPGASRDWMAAYADNDSAICMCNSTMAISPESKPKTAIVIIRATLTEGAPFLACLLVHPCAWGWHWFLEAYL